jgi:hypothetical protein
MMAPRADSQSATKLRKAGLAATSLETGSRTKALSAHPHPPAVQNLEPRSTTTFRKAEFAAATRRRVDTRRVRALRVLTTKAVAVEHHPTAVLMTRVTIYHSMRTLMTDIHLIRARTQTSMSETSFWRSITPKKCSAIGPVFSSRSRKTVPTTANLPSQILHPFGPQKIIRL